jgi:hypothetical protein
MQFFECFLLNAMKNEENKGNNAIFWIVAIYSADERIRLVRLLRYSNKETRDKLTRGAYTNIFYLHETRYTRVSQVFSQSSLSTCLRQ